MEQNNKLFLKIDKRIQSLTDTEAYLYFIIVYTVFVDKDVNAEYLCKCLDIKCHKYLSEMLKNLEDVDLIKRSYTYVNNKFTGEIVNKKVKFALNYNSFYKVELDFIKCDLEPKLKGFALKLRCLALDTDVTIGYNKKEISAILKADYKTVCKKMNALGFLQLVENGYVFTEYFMSVQINYLNKQNISLIKEIIANKDDSKLYKQTLYFIKNKLYLYANANKLFDDILAGTFGLEKN